MTMKRKKLKVSKLRGLAVSNRETRSNGREERGNEQMPQQHSLTINANDRFTIDAGYWQECVERDQMPSRLISPPQTTMYQQTLSYLEEATKAMKVPPKSQLHFGEVAIATVAVCLRWGSYFAVLTKHDLPQWTDALNPEVSCIGDGEMAPINTHPPPPPPRWIHLMPPHHHHS